MLVGVGSHAPMQWLCEGVHWIGTAIQHANEVCWHFGGQRTGLAGGYAFPANHWGIPSRLYDTPSWCYNSGEVSPKRALGCGAWTSDLQKTCFDQGDFLLQNSPILGFYYIYMYIYVYIYIYYDIYYGYDRYKYLNPKQKTLNYLVNR